MAATPLPDTAILEVIKGLDSWSDINAICALNRSVYETCVQYQETIKAHVLFNKFGRNVLSNDQYWQIGTNAETTQKLVDLGVNITEDVLFQAAQRGLLDVIRILHIAGGDIRAQEDHILRIAARNGHMNLVIYLLDNGADPRVNDLDMNVIFQAVISRNVNLVRYLHQERGIDIHVNNDSCFLLGASLGDVNMVQYFLQNGADVNADNSQALIDAVEMDSTELVRLLIEYHVDVTAHNNEAIVLASNFVDTDIMEILLENGADPNARAARPLYNAVSNSATNGVRMLLENGAVVTGEAFIESAVVGNDDIMRLLINSDVNIVQEHGEDAMDEAIDGKWHRIVKLLMRSGLEFNQEQLYRAVSRDYDSIRIVMTILRNTNTKAISDEVIEHAIELAENEDNKNIAEFLRETFFETDSGSG